MMAYYLKQIGIKHFLILCLLGVLTGCGNDYAEQIQQRYLVAKTSLDNLERKLQAKELTNAKIVNIYAQKLAQIKPDLLPVAKAMRKDATEYGALYQGLLDRLNEVNRNPENKEQFKQASDALISIDMGADPIVFNDALIDLINTMAELSGGKLETISIPEDSQAANSRGDVTPGSYLVGNPGYGEYRNDSSGRSMWHWYGQYAFFSSILGRNHYNRGPIYYDRWNSGYHNSYYNDYGRGSYGSYSDRSRTTQRNTTMRNNGHTPVTQPRKQYGSVKGRQRVSSYKQQRSNQSSYFKTKKANGGRHASKVSGKRSSGFLGSKKSSSSSSSRTKRSSSYFGSSSRSSRSSGGK
ncbi:MAG: hypothetical protein GQ582_05065 [Methyloprofundus sp.]|nr:hypothetical protein [Methyloprofundus sp.]